MKKLTHVDGDLLKHKTVQVIGHQANCQNTMGSGIARSIKDMYPEAYLADTLCKVSPEVRLGRFSFANIPLIGNVNRYNNHICRIYNLYGQNLGTNHAKYDRKTNYEALYCALESMSDSLMSDADIPFPNVPFGGSHPTVGFPFLLGSALGGGDWNIVERLIESAFTGYEAEVLIVHFKP